MFSDLFDPQDPLGVMVVVVVVVVVVDPIKTVHSTEPSLGICTILHSATDSSREYPNKAVSRDQWVRSSQVC